MEKLVENSVFNRLKKSFQDPLLIGYRYRHILIILAIIAFFPTFIFLFYSIFNLKSY